MMWPQPEHGPRFEPVAPSDFEAMVALRIRAMRPSLEALGRFDPERARQRLAEGFAPAFMRHIVVGDQRVGFTTLRPVEQGLALELDHLYIEPAHQGRGIGAWVVDGAKSRADLLQLPLVVEALLGSDANRFYQRQGFVEQARGEFDITYRRAPRTSPVDVVRELWARFQARDWAGARELVHDDLHIDWWASGEALTTGDAFIAVNAEYPEGWSIHPMHFAALDDGRVLSFVRVEHPPQGVFLVQSVVLVRDGRIAHGHELWSTCEAPPAWRTPARFPGLVVKA
jgi:GNAT superfamily N-acetyltransferase/ketosteroid isomerase-like protein